MGGIRKATGCEEKTTRQICTTQEETKSRTEY